MTRFTKYTYTVNLLRHSIINSEDETYTPSTEWFLMFLPSISSVPKSPNQVKLFINDLLIIYDPLYDICSLLLFTLYLVRCLNKSLLCLSIWVNNTRLLLIRTPRYPKLRFRKTTVYIRKRRITSNNDMGRKVSFTCTPLNFQDKVIRIIQNFRFSSYTSTIFPDCQVFSRFTFQF